MVKKTFCFSQITSCCIPSRSLYSRSSYYTTYIRHVRGLRDIRKIAQSLKSLGYNLDENTLIMDFHDYEDVTASEAAQLGLHKEPRAYKIRGDGIEIKIENFSRPSDPNVIGGKSEDGVRGYIELAKPDRETFERIESIIKSYLTVKEGYNRKDVFDIERIPEVMGIKRLFETIDEKRIMSEISSDFDFWL